MNIPKADISVMPNGNLMIHIPMLIKRMQGRKIVIAPQALDGKVEKAPVPVQSAIVQALARAYAWTERLESDTAATIGSLADELNMDSSFLTRILKLTFLAPDIVEAILQGKEPSGLSLSTLLKGFPEDWEEQRKVLGFNQRNDSAF